MKNNTTEVVFIIDKSGSMHGFENDTVGGFNSAIEEQKKQEGTIYVSTVFFNNTSEVVHDRVTIDKVSPLTEADYRAGGCTALLDAIGDAVHHIKNIHKYARPEDVPEHTVFIITTDGMENSSMRYTLPQIKQIIKEQTDEHGWEFVFMSANIDAVETAAGLGIGASRAVNWSQDESGFKAQFMTISNAISYVHTNASLSDGDWRKPSDDDMTKKKPRKEGK